VNKHQSRGFLFTYLRWRSTEGNRDRRRGKKGFREDATPAWKKHGEKDNWGLRLKVLFHFRKRQSRERGGTEFNAETWSLGCKVTGGEAQFS